MNVKCSCDITKRYNKSEVTFYCRKCDHDFVHQDQYTVNSDNLLPLVVLDGYLTLKMICQEEKSHSHVYTFLYKQTNPRKL